MGTFVSFIGVPGLSQKKVFLVVSAVIGKNGSEVFARFFGFIANTNRTKRSFHAFYLEKLSVAKLRMFFFFNFLSFQFLRAITYSVTQKYLMKGFVTSKTFHYMIVL